MDRTSYGAIAARIGQLTDVNQLMLMLKNPQYSGYTNIIIARIQEITHMKQAATGATPPQPPVAQQVVQQAAQPGMARGGIVAFRHGGKVRKFDDGGITTDPNALLHSRINMASKFNSSVPLSWGAQSQAAGGYTPPFTPVDINQYFAGMDTPMASGISFGGGSRGGYTPTPVPNVPSLGEDVAQYDKYVPVNNDLADARAQLAEMKASRLKQQAQSPYMALMRAGLGMVQSASTNPHAGFIGNLAAGAGEGLNQYLAERQMLEKSQETEIANQLKSGQITQQEAADRFRAAQWQYRADVQDKIGAERVNAQMQNQYRQMQMWNRPAAIMDARAIQFAKELADRDQKAGLPLKTRGEYYSEALQLVNPAYGIASLRGQQATQGQKAAFIQKMSGGDQSLVPYYSQQFDMLVANGKDPMAMMAAGGGGTNYGSLE